MHEPSSNDPVSRERLPLELLGTDHENARDAVRVGQEPAFEGRGALDYVCGQCGSVLCAGARPRLFMGVVFRCACGELNRVPSA